MTAKCDRSVSLPFGIELYSSVSCRFWNRFVKQNSLKEATASDQTVQQKMRSGEIRPTVKPDFDNIGKLIADALNGVAYDDDKCIVDAQVRKFYSDNPRTEVILQIATI